MKKHSWALLCLLILCFNSCTESASRNETSPEVVKIIPHPLDVQGKKGEFVWNDKSEIIITTENEELRRNALSLQEILAHSLGKNIEIKQGSATANNAIIFHLDTQIKGDEAYQLDVTKDRVLISAPNNAGLFYGMQSLLQLLPSEVFKANGLAEGFSINGIFVNDSPRFGYRGMHLDVSRNFVKKDDVKKFIDMLSKYKFNRFHWHLTDGSGWRIEIKKYPLLTQKTAFRAQSTWKGFWNEGGRRFVDEGTPNSYGGYYSQDDIREIVAYASERYITIIPEIEMPAHSEEVFVAYPQFSCSGIPYKDSDFCPGNDEAFQFVEDVLTEVIDLFPSQLIHIGGDEAGKSAWKTCTKCKKRLATENLKDVDELQSYFVKRVSKFLTSKGRSLLGWDEIVEGGLAADATIMLWRDPKTGVQAARDGHNVIMTPGSHCYFDFYQADPATEPEAIGGYTPLRKVYSFEVVPNDSLASFFIGGQANLWTEYIPTYEHVEYMVFPRAVALSEAVWSAKKNRNWDNFKERFHAQLSRFDYLGVNYHKPSFELEMFTKVDQAKKQMKVYFENEQRNPIIRYTIDGSSPTNESMLYSDTIVFGEPVILTAAMFKDGEAQKEVRRYVGYHLSIGKKVDYLKKWTSYPAGGEAALVDGLLGGPTYGDGLWQGFTNDLEVVIDLEAVTKVHTFNSKFMQLIGPGVYMPKYVEVFGSIDGKTYESLLKIENDIPMEHDRLLMKNFSGTLNGKEARYIKVFAKNNIGFIFTDELIVN